MLPEITHNKKPMVVEPKVIDAKEVDALRKEGMLLTKSIRNVWGKKTVVARKTVKSKFHFCK